MPKYDIIIVGAGLVGTSLACALANTDLSITLLERQLQDISEPPTPDSRPITLTYSSVTALKQLGIWETLAPVACPLTDVHVSEANHFGLLHITAHEMNLPALGYVVPAAHLTHALYKKAAQSAHIQCIDAIESITHTDEGARINEMEASLLVGADGNASRVRECLNIAVEQSDHHQIAITGTLTLKHQINTGYERFTKEGVVAILPRLNQQAGLVWTLPNALFEERKHWSDAQWMHAIHQHMGERLPLISFKKGSHFPLSTHTAKEQVSKHCVLLGNSAHAFYPIAAQGFNLGLRDCAQLAELIIDQHHHHKPINDAAMLQHYLDRRLPDQQHIQQLVARTTGLFELTVPGIGHVRSLGLLASNLLSPIKRRIAKRALGYGGATPPLLREDIA